MSDRYFQEELRYLTEAAKEFAAAHPEQARMLNIDSIADRDPYVERLFEGFAFLAARVREKLDDEFPEFLRGLFAVLWPQMLRPIPALTLLEFRPRAGMLQGVRRVAAGVAVQSNPVPPDGVRCRFRTCLPVDLYPLRVADVRIDRAADGQPALRFKFQLDDGVDAAALDLKALRMHIHADPAAAYQLHHALTRDVQAVMTARGGSLLGEQALITPAGFAADEAVIPAARASHPAYTLLMEYFCFREKFLAVDFAGLHRVPLLKGESVLDVQVVLKRPLQDGLRFSAENFRLYCTPAVNLFELDAEPVRVDHSRFRYRVLPSTRHARSYEITEVTAVTSTELGTGRQRKYLPFDEFRFGPRTTERSFSWTSEFGPSERWETHVSLHGVEPSGDGPLPENLSVTTMVTNGALPRELNEGQLNVPTDETPAQAAFGNLTKPTLPLYPPRREQYQWQLVSLLSHNHLSLDRVEYLRDLLALFDWSGLEANARRVKGLQSLKVSAHDWLLDGSVFHGALIEIEVNEAHFSGRGDAHIFGLVLLEFFRRYVTINAMVELRMTCLPSQEIYAWTPEAGTQPLL